jgi:hypothetical protein
MVGNDTQHDMAAGQVGLLTCLLTPWRIDHWGFSFPADWEGHHEEFLCLLQEHDEYRFADRFSNGRTLFSAD